MKTKDALMIGYQLGRIQRTLDAWEESKHKRDKSGKFTSGGGSVGKMPKNLKYNKGKTDLVKKANSPEHWMNKKEAAQENAVQKFKEQIKNGTISEKEKRDLAEGRAMVKSGEWTKNDYERQIRGIAISKMENEKSGAPTKEILRKVKNAYMNAEGHDGMDKFHIDWAIKDSHGKISEEKIAETLRIKNGSKESKLAVNTLKAYKDKQITKRDAQNMLAAIIGGKFASER